MTGLGLFHAIQFKNDGFMMMFIMFRWNHQAMAPPQDFQTSSESLRFHKNVLEQITFKHFSPENSYKHPLNTHIL